ncbi:MAG: hypothetical protein ACERKZ_19570 [Lachnotalea sp.]
MTGTSEKIKWSSKNSKIITDDAIYMGSSGTSYSFSDSVSYKYFLLTDQEIAKDHQWYSKKKCNGDVTKYISIFGEVLTTKDDIQNYFVSARKSGNNEGVVVINRSLFDEYYEKGNYYIFYFKWK